MKYQQCKFIDVLENPNEKVNPFFTDLDSDINNQASIDDAKDYIHLPDMDTLRESALATKTYRSSS